MHVPFSMSDEPDLGDEFKGIRGDYEHIEPILINDEHVPVFTRANMTAAIQANLKAREDLQRTIADMHSDMWELEEDLMYAKDALRDIRDWINDPNGFSKYALEVIVKRGLRE